MEKSGLKPWGVDEHSHFFRTGVFETLLGEQVDGHGADSFENLRDALVPFAEIAEEFEFVDEVAGLNIACLHFLQESFEVGRKDANQHSDMFAILSVSLGKIG